MEGEETDCRGCTYQCTDTKSLVTYFQLILLMGWVHKKAID